jgi:hypothetical protein
MDSVSDELILKGLAPCFRIGALHPENSVLASQPGPAYPPAHKSHG